MAAGLWRWRGALWAALLLLAAAQEPWRQLIQWENNGRLYSLLNSGAEFVPAGQERPPGSRLWLAGTAGTAAAAAAAGSVRRQAPASGTVRGQARHPFGFGQVPPNWRDGALGDGGAGGQRRQAARGRQATASGVAVSSFAFASAGQPPLVAAGVAAHGERAEGVPASRSAGWARRSRCSPARLPRLSGRSRSPTERRGCRWIAATPTASTTTAAPRRKPGRDPWKIWDLGRSSRPTRRSRRSGRPNPLGSLIPSPSFPKFLRPCPTAKPGSAWAASTGPALGPEVSRTWSRTPTTSRPPRTCRERTCTRCAAPPRSAASPARRTRPRPPTTTCGCCCASRSASRTRAQPTSCPASPGTAGSGTAATSTTTAWRSSATTTCWMSPRAAGWPRDTRPASAWRTPPATSATSSATPAPPTPRGSARAVTTPTTPTSTASGSTSPTSPQGTTSSRSRSIPNIWCWSRISPTTSCAATSTTPGASCPPPTAASPNPDGSRTPGVSPVPFPGKFPRWLRCVPKVPPFPNKKRGSHEDSWESFLSQIFPAFPGKCKAEIKAGTPECSIKSS